MEQNDTTVMCSSAIPYVVLKEREGTELTPPKVRF